MNTIAMPVDLLPIVDAFVTEKIETMLRIDSDQELAYLRSGGILPYVIRKTVGAARAAA